MRREKIIATVGRHRFVDSMSIEKGHLRSGNWWLSIVTKKNDRLFYACRDFEELADILVDLNDLEKQ